MALTYFSTDLQEFSRMQTQWQSQLGPLLANPFNNSQLLLNITLTTGVNVINHKLGRMQAGWIQTDINAAITLFRSAPLSTTTLTLTASGPAIVSLEVF